MKNINTSYFDFATLRNPKRNYVYVDKTAQLYEIAKEGAEGIYYFPRPRRFGKSLMISTFKYLFQGRRDLFKGLAIDSMDWDWESEVYPVLHLDMSQVPCCNAEEARVKIQDMVRGKCEEFGLPFNPALPCDTNFKNLLEKLPTVAPQKAEGKFVVLIDEYDAPIAGLLDTPEGRAELPKVRKALHDFYVQAKSLCGNMRFLMVTGVSKFAKTSIFSAFNNPCDLTLDRRTADLLGYTHEEMEKYFHEHIQAFADENDLTYAEAFETLIQWYDSYQFSPERLVKVINPVSLGNALSKRTLGNYWEATAGSTLIYDAMRAGNKAPIDFEATVDREILDSPDALTAPAEALLYQGGYLTIDHVVVKNKVRKLQLRIPNEEVRISLQRGYMAETLGRDFQLSGFKNAADSTADAIAEDPTGSTIKQLLVTAYSKLPHDWVCKDEKEAKRYFLSFMIFARAEVVGEEQHSAGRPDAVLRTEQGVYIFEFKYNETAAAAIKQCWNRHYADAFADEKRKMRFIGINYDPATRTINDFASEEIV